MCVKTQRFSPQLVADILSVSKANVLKRINSGELNAFQDGRRTYVLGRDLVGEPRFDRFVNSRWDEELNVPSSEYQSVELFAGGGGLALGAKLAGLSHSAMVELDPSACRTLRNNFPDVNVIERDISLVDFTSYRGASVVSGGFPCQSFSYSGKRLGLTDVRGTLFYEFARAVREIQPEVFVAENVRGILTDDGGKTIETILGVFREIGYTVLEPELMNSLFYKVPQKRERVIIIGIREDLDSSVFEFPSAYYKPLVLRDALISGELYQTDCPISEGSVYPARKKEIMSFVPEGGYWRDLPLHLQKEYMKASFNAGGGKTGMARRLSFDEPSLTLTTSPAQKQTERCHPKETRPLTVREYARIQTFPDSYSFSGSTSAMYRQIGNAVPVEMASSIFRSVLRFLDKSKR